MKRVRMHSLEALMENQGKLVEMEKEIRVVRPRWQGLRTHIHRHLVCPDACPLNPGQANLSPPKSW